MKNAAQNEEATLGGRREPTVGGQEPMFFWTRKARNTRIGLTPWVRSSEIIGKNSVYSVRSVFEKTYRKNIRPISEISG